MNESGGTLRVLTFMRDGQWHTAREIEEACEVTCHSRISDLRNEHGHVIAKRRNPKGTGRSTFSYRLVAESDAVRESRELAREPEPVVAGETLPPPSLDASPMPVAQIIDLLARHGWVEYVETESLFDGEELAA